MRNPSSVCIVLFCLVVCCFLFNILHKPALIGAVASPLPPAHLGESLQWFRRQELGIFGNVSLWWYTEKLALCVEPGQAWNLQSFAQARFGYQGLITNEHRWGWPRWEVLALFWGTSEQEFQEHWLFVLLWCKKSDDGLSLMSASDVFPTWRCSLHLTLYHSVLNSNIWGPVT